MSDLKKQVTVTMPVEYYEGLIHKKSLDTIHNRYFMEADKLEEYIKDVPKDSPLYISTEATIKAYKEVCFEIQCAR